jgi:hypothetical protein
MELTGIAKEFDEFVKRILINENLSTYQTTVANMLEKSKNKDDHVSIVLVTFFGQAIPGLIEMIYIFAKGIKEKDQSKEFLKNAQTILLSQINVLFDHYVKLADGEEASATS